MKVIDAHVHLVQCIAGTGAGGEMRSIGGGQGIYADGSICQLIPKEWNAEQVTPERILAVMDAHEVERAVLLQGEYLGFQNQYSYEAQQKYPERFLAAAAYDPYCRNRDAIVRHLFERQGIRVVKFEVSTGSGLMANHPVFALDGEMMEREAAFAEEHGLVFVFWNVKSNCWEIEGGEYALLIGASVEDIRLCEKITVHGTAAVHSYEDMDLDCYYKGDVLSVSDADFEKLLGHPIPDGKTKIDRNLTLGELNHARSPLGWLVWFVLTILLDASYKRGKPDLNILFQYNMPLRAFAKMTNGAISMGMVDGIVMELQGFWIIGLVRVIYEAIKNVVLNM